MKRLLNVGLIGLMAILACPIFAKTQAKTPAAPSAQNQEVVLSTSAGSKLGVAMSNPQASGLDPAVVAKDFQDVLQRDLDEAGPFGVIKSGLPAGVEPSTYPAWVAAGVDWLLVTKLGRGTGDDLEVVLQVQDTKSGKNVFGKKYVGKVAGIRRIAHTISDDLVARLTGDRGVALSRIVFVRQISPGLKEIFQMDRDGTGIVALTNNKSLSLSPSISSDGRLVYLTYKGGMPEIWGQLTPGGPQVKLFPKGNQPEGHCYTPSWSPDGKQILFVQGDRRGNTDIAIFDVATGRVRRLTDGSCSNAEPCWNPSGTQIAFTSDRDGSPQIFLMESDGSNVRRLTREGTYNATAAWSPSGSMIAYVSRFDGKFDLFVYKLGEGKSYQVTTGLASSESPAWSPDERAIVFSSGSRGGMQLYTSDLSGNSLRRLTEFSGCQSPRWTRAR